MYGPLLFLLMLSLSYSYGQTYDYPKFPAKPVTENIFGTTVTDPYRNMESVKDSTVQNWFGHQEKLTKSILDTLSTVSQFYEAIQSANAKTLSWANRVRLDEKGSIFYTKQPENELPFKLFMADKKGNNEKLLLNPENYNSDIGDYRIDDLKPSWNGEYVAVSLSKSGDFSSELFVIECASGKVVSDTLTHLAPSKFNGIHWLPDSSGFTYTYFPIITKGQKGFKENSYARLHIIGKKQEEDSNIFGNTIDTPIKRELFPATKVSSSNSKYILGYAAAASPYYDTYFATIESVRSGVPDWKLLHKADWKVLGGQGQFIGDRYYFMSAKWKENFGIYYIDMKNIDFSSPTIVVDGHAERVINDFVPTKNGIYFTVYENGVRAELQYKSGKTTRKVSIPGDAGKIVLKSNINIHGNKILIECSGWATDLMRYTIDDGAISQQIELVPIPLYPEFNALIVEELEIEGHDGAMVPLSLIYNSARRKRASMPTLLIAYGAFGTNQSPFFSPSRLAWVAQGGMLAIAHIRGGGEKGQDWHDAGKKETKKNSWKDIISSAAYMISKGYTDNRSIALYGRSAGGIAGGMAINQRSDLFRVFLGDVPKLNPTRSTAGSYRNSTYLEYGAIENPKEAPFLIAMDPYLNIKENKKYPAVLLSPSSKDNRIDLWESGKYIARLQQANTSENPTLLDVRTGGHSVTPRMVKARLFGFAWWQIQLRR